MKTSFLLSVAAALFLAGCGDNSSNGSGKPAPGTNASVNYNSGNPATVVPDYVGAVGQAQQYSEKQIDLAYLNQAIQQFNAAEGHYPKTLQELIPNYIGKMPSVPAGYKMDYNPVSGAVSVVKQ
jgi:hypothetical protein